MLALPIKKKRIPFFLSKPFIIQSKNKRKRHVIPHDDTICFFVFFLFTLLWSIRKALENRTNMEDDRVAILEAQVAQAKLIAEEADKKY